MLLLLWGGVEWSGVKGREPTRRDMDRFWQGPVSTVQSRDPAAGGAAGRPRLITSATNKAGNSLTTSTLSTSREREQLVEE